MARKSIAVNAEKQAANDAMPMNDQVKFVCKYPDYHFMMPVIGHDGKQERHTDANGNNSLPTYRDYHFARVNPKDPMTGKTSVSECYSIFIVDREKHGAMFQPIVDYLTKLTKNSFYKVYTDDDWFRIRNPEAFRIAREKSEYEDKLTDAQRRIIELERKLGLPASKGQ
jgi:hypothetical protein